MGDWSNERMRELGAGSGTMSDRRARELDTQTDALVRVAAALAHGTVSDLKARFAAARDARVPDLWVEELLLQSLLVVGYPRALVAFGVWRASGAGGPAREEEGGGGAGGWAQGGGEGWGARGGGAGRGARGG